MPARNASAALSAAVLLLVASSSSVGGGAEAAPRVSACAPPSAAQQWRLGADGRLESALAATCLATADCAPAKTGAVEMLDCGATTCGAVPARNLRWALEEAQGLLSSAASNGSLCLTLASGDGPEVNLWPCDGAQPNAQWDAVPAPTAPGFVTLATRDAGAGRGCLTADAGPGGVAQLNASALGRRVYGIGGLAAIGGARLIYEYAEPVRSQILDLVFSTTGGTAMQIVKTEIEGDVDSSYGSGPAFQHARGEVPSFKRGIYLPWLLGEAKKRNAAIGTYALSWGLPGYVGNGSGFLTLDSLDWHMAYLNGVRETYNYSFDLVGVHNERPFSRAYTIALRAALDAAGFNATLISVNDASNSGCTDCGAFKDDSITTALASDPSFAAALGYIGLHSAGLLPKTDYDWERAGKEYIQSEANDVDGPLIETADGSFPQWAPNDGSPQGPGLEWPLHFLSNYIDNRVTGMIICPLQRVWGIKKSPALNPQTRALTSAVNSQPPKFPSPDMHGRGSTGATTTARRSSSGRGTVTSCSAPRFGRRRTSHRPFLRAGTFSTAARAERRARPRSELSSRPRSTHSALSQSTRALRPSRSPSSSSASSPHASRARRSRRGFRTRRSSSDRPTTRQHRRPMAPSRTRSAPAPC